MTKNGIKIHVFGNGWEDFAGDDAVNLVWEKGDYLVARDAVANAYISLNTQPWFKGGFQERIASAMLSGTVAVTDDSLYIEFYRSGIVHIFIREAGRTAGIDQISFRR